MANLIRSAKSGSEWTGNELQAYHIVVEEQPSEQFFGGPLPEYTGPPGFLEYERLPADELALEVDATSRSLFTSLDIVMEVEEESAVDDFAVELLRAMDYEGDRIHTKVRARKGTRLFVCGMSLFAKNDVCVVEMPSGILLGVEEDKTNIRLLVNPLPAEAQLVAEAIAAFQANNLILQDPLEEATIPAILLVRSYPIFYKIRVTAALDQAVRQGQYPVERTTVFRHTPEVPQDRASGMLPLENRRILVQCYEAFKQFVLYVFVTEAKKLEF